ncbi:hypothetical protein BJX68DRAFT_144388 [Aspergillus pseudodeflectus]|uniref:DUF2470 domain-containing protein n=1 Tax=Aspergillus pseudodeflectus TaxID=176178 RepID=A0ABR4L464_9EURO
MSSPLLPSTSAPASTVRTYITQTLITTHAVTPDVAELLAEKWDIGRGHEFRQASLGHLQRVFGDNVGLCLYHAVREASPAPVEVTRLQVWSLVAADITGLLLTGVVILRFMPNVLGLGDQRDPIMWAANPAWWLAFGVCAVNAAYQRRIQSIRDGLLLVGGWLAFLVGIKLAQR